MKRIFPLLGVLLVAASAYAGDPIYRCTDQEGNKTFTTNPSPDMDCELLDAFKPKKKRRPKTKKRKTNQGQTLVAIRAERMYEHFDENELAAEEHYKNKVFTVYGEISDISQAFGKPYINLDAGFSSARVVQCLFDKEEKKYLLSLSKGQTVSVKGVCKGMTLTMVSVVDCELQ